MEVERKFLVRSSVSLVDGESILQGYICIGAGGVEVRLRRKGAAYFETVKRGSGIERDEVEVMLCAEQFWTLWVATEGRRLEKRRYAVPLGEGLVAEIDVYGGRLEGLMCVEVEFGSVDTASEFVPPEWFGREVTEDVNYKNRSLATVGLPHYWNAP